MTRPPLTVNYAASKEITQSISNFMYFEVCACMYINGNFEDLVDENILDAVASHILDSYLKDESHTSISTFVDKCADIIEEESVLDFLRYTRREVCSEVLSRVYG